MKINYTKIKKIKEQGRMDLRNKKGRIKGQGRMDLRNKKGRIKEQGRMDLRNKKGRIKEQGECVAVPRRPGDKTYSPTQDLSNFTTGSVHQGIQNFNIGRLHLKS